MSLIGHQGGLSIGKAERPGPSLGKKVNKDATQSTAEKPSSSSSSQSSTVERRGLGQMIGGILHSQRRDEAQQARAASLEEDRSDVASLSSVATEKRALLKAAAEKKKDKGRSYGKPEPKLPNPNDAMMPRNRFWS
ncbi:hypothetical protein BBK36DRAFT_1165092 [Trichoderma citrinoviride]|uniref:Uncharacterized protein n=1 Tax=Trichoderma citrinoviride TaxID=58853 RepID=A0A2T4BMN3_9HYPO|nr:hypothetical protein BBK36DRAFT_1165092 [Trichoderma citrinoviride]PTB70568.1 hypothetical protein BBK36DRAFT_1165092 [Trichoderma citrinoviride]